MKCLRIQLKINRSLDAIDTVQVKAEIDNLLATRGIGQIELNPIQDLEILSSVLKDQYNEEEEIVSVSSGCLQGCYGSNTGRYDEGLTLYFHPKAAFDRIVNEDGDEVVNPWFLLEEHGKLLEGQDGETFEALCDESDIETKSDNTYNFNGHSSEDCVFLFDFQFTTAEIGKKTIASIMFHCGGDIRGNYTRKQVWSFDHDDFYNVIFPYKFLTDNEAV